MICNIQQNFAHIEIPATIFNINKLKWLASEIYELDFRKNNGYIVLETFADNSPKIIRDLFLSGPHLSAWSFLSTKGIIFLLLF